MHSRIFKNSFLALFIAVSVMFLMGKGNATELKDSVLDIVGEFMSTEPELKPDLAIESVNLRKISEPKEDFHYYRYYATIVVKNVGGDIEDAKAKLSAGAGQPHLFLKNSQNGFSLKHGEKYILDKYEVLFDARYNAGELKFELEMLDCKDSDLSSNEAGVKIMEFPAAIRDIALETVKENGEYFVQFDEKSEFYDHKVEIYVGSGDGGGDYYEAKGEKGIYSYEKVAIDSSILESKNFAKSDYDHVGSYELNLGVPLSKKENTDYLYVKVVNPANGYYALSDVLKLPSQTKLTRADFAKSFVELTGEAIGNVGESGFADVTGTEWYAPYAKAIYDLGLLNFEMQNFEADQVVTREQALKIAMDYYDIDLVGGGDLELADVDKNDELYQYLISFNHVDKVVHGGEFLPAEAASLDFLKYLIYAYK